MQIIDSDIVHLYEIHILQLKFDHLPGFNLRDFFWNLQIGDAIACLLPNTRTRVEMLD